MIINWNGITGSWSWIIGKISEFCGGLVNGFKSALGIASPSKVMRDHYEIYARNRGIGRNGGINMIKTFLLSNLPEFQEILGIEKTDHITLEVEINILTLEYRVYGNNFDLTVQEPLGEGVLTKEELEFISGF